MDFDSMTELVAGMARRHPLGNVDTDKCSPHGERSKFYWFFVDRPHSFSLFSISSQGDLLIMKCWLADPLALGGPVSRAVCDFEFIINLNVIHLGPEFLFD